jgi:hypothetical protein
MPSYDYVSQEREVDFFDPLYAPDGIQEEQSGGVEYHGTFSSVVEA